MLDQLITRVIVQDENTRCNFFNVVTRLGQNKVLQRYQTGPNSESKLSGITSSCSTRPTLNFYQYKYKQLLLYSFDLFGPIIFTVTFYLSRFIDNKFLINNKSGKFYNLIIKLTYLSEMSLKVLFIYISLLNLINFYQ